MKFEEVLPALRQGMRMKVKGHFDEYYYSENYRGEKSIYSNEGIEVCLTYLLKNDWEIVQEKVKYYPALVKFVNNNEYMVLKTLFKNKEHYREWERNENLKGVQLIRLITEIPELIEERDE